MADWWPRLADVDGGLLLAREGRSTASMLASSSCHHCSVLRGLRRLGGGCFVAAALQLGLGLPGSLPGADRLGGPFLIPRAGRLQPGFLRGHLVSQCSGLMGLHQVVFCFGGRRLLPGVGLSLGCQPQPSGDIRRCGRLRAFALEYAGLEFTAAHDADLGVLIGNLQSLEGVALHGGELWLRMRCSVNGLPVQDRSPQRFSSAYSLSRIGPRTFRTCRCPRAGLMVRRMNPSLVCRVDTSHGAIAAYSSRSFAMVAPDSGVRPSAACLRNLPSSMYACCSVLAVP